jgi:glycerol-3-phosphate dehydrogenase
MTSKALYKLGVEHNVDLPIVGAVYRALFEHASINDEIQQLFLRSVKDEF